MTVSLGDWHRAAAWSGPRVPDRHRAPV